MIEIVSATRLSHDAFWMTSALGQSLLRLSKDTALVHNIAYSNRRGLPEVFNARIEAPDSADILVFTHDDIWLDDFFLTDRLAEGLRTYDVIGVAGNRRIVPGQVAWAFVDEQFTWDEQSNLSGAVAHGANPCGAVSFFGLVPAECELLDGAFLAARKSALMEKRVTFDARFSFHFYDMDFCRSARQAGLTLGTWPICLTHQSDGQFGSPAWCQGRDAYRRKWPS